MAFDFRAICERVAADDAETVTLHRHCLKEILDRLIRLEAASEIAAPWLSAALSDHRAGAEMKTDLRTWFKLVGTTS